MELKIKLYQLKEWYSHIDRAIINMPDGGHLVLDTDKIRYPFIIWPRTDEKSKGGDFAWETDFGYTIVLSQDADVTIEIHDYAYDLRNLISNIHKQGGLLGAKDDNHQ